MKKLIFSLAALIASIFSAQAITVQEAYEQISALPGVALSDMPSHDVLKDGMDWGKVAMFIMVPESTLKSVNGILDEITDEVALDKMVVDQSTGKATNPVRCFTQQVEPGKKIALMSVFMPSRKSCIIQYCQGGDNVVEKLEIK